jgi:hypothetical protein
MPHFCDVWEDQWENKWWPEKLRARPNGKGASARA